MNRMHVMTVGDLKRLLQKAPDHLLVVASDEDGEDTAVCPVVAAYLYQSRRADLNEDVFNIDFRLEEVTGGYGE